MSEQSNNAGLGNVAYVVRSVEGATAIARGNITNSKMSNRPTLETDAFAKAMYKRGVDCHHDGREALKHAKRLERERDEAREEWGKASMDAAQLLSEKTKVIAERDEAREELAEAKREAENLAKSIYRSEYSDNDTDWELLDSVAGVISQIDNMYAGVREQRDEAREQLSAAKHFLEKYIAERDEAIAERDILRLNSLGTIQLNIPVTTDWKEEIK